MSDTSDHDTPPAGSEADATTTRSVHPTPPAPATAPPGTIAGIPRQQVVGLIIGGLRSLMSRSAPVYLPRPAPAPAAESDRRSEDRPTSSDPPASRVSRKRTPSD